MKNEAMLSWKKRDERCHGASPDRCVGLCGGGDVALGGGLKLGDTSIAAAIADLQRVAIRK